MIAALVIAGLAAHSLALVSEGADFFADSAALGLGLLAIHLRDRHRNEKATTWVALINGVWLVMLSAWVAVAAVVRLVHGSRDRHRSPVVLARRRRRRPGLRHRCRLRGSALPRRRCGSAYRSPVRTGGRLAPPPSAPAPLVDTPRTHASLGPRGDLLGVGQRGEARAQPLAASPARYRAVGRSGF